MDCGGLPTDDLGKPPQRENREICVLCSGRVRSSEQAARNRLVFGFYIFFFISKKKVWANHHTSIWPDIKPGQISISGQISKISKIDFLLSRSWEVCVRALEQAMKNFSKFFDRSKKYRFSKKIGANQCFFSVKSVHTMH